MSSNIELHQPPRTGIPKTENVEATIQSQVIQKSPSELNVEAGGKQPEGQPPSITEEKEEGYSLLKCPIGKSCFKQIMWVVTWPIYLVFYFTIPDCEKPRLKKWFPITFLMCIIWIGSLSYMVAWMITIVGMRLLKIPPPKL